MVEPGTYTLSETGGPDGYTPSAWSCVNGDGPAFMLGSGGTLPIVLGDDLTCTITNVAQAPAWDVEKTADPHLAPPSSRATPSPTR